jgi:hypothetical protein
MNASYIAAYLVDPYYAVHDKGLQTYTAPQVDLELFEEAAVLLRQVGGDAAEAQLRSLRTVGYPKAAQGWVKQLIDIRLQVEVQLSDKNLTGKRSRLARVPSARTQYVTWDKLVGMPELDSIRPVALRLLSAHTMSATTERNWAL